MIIFRFLNNYRYQELKLEPDLTRLVASSQIPAKNVFRASTGTGWLVIFWKQRTMAERCAFESVFSQNCNKTVYLTFPQPNLALLPPSKNLFCRQEVHDTIFKNLTIIIKSTETKSKVPIPALHTLSLQVHNDLFLKKIKQIC